PKHVIPLLNDYADVIVSAIHEQDGDVLKFMGDGILAIFTADDRTRACNAALAAAMAARRGVAELNQRRAAAGLPVTDMYLGLHVGEGALWQGREYGAARFHGGGTGRQRSQPDRGNVPLGRTADAGVRCICRNWKQQSPPRFRRALRSARCQRRSGVVYARPKRRRRRRRFQSRRARGTRALDLFVAAEGLADGARIGAQERIERDESLPQRSNAGVISATSGKSSPSLRSRERRSAGGGDSRLFERVGDPQRDVFAPRRRDDLHTDRQRLERYRHRHHRQADERDRLGVDAEIGAHGKLDAVEHEGLLADGGRGARRRRREHGVDMSKQGEHLLAIPTAEFLRL